MNHLPSLSKKLTFGDLFRQTFPLSPLRGSHAGDDVRKPCYARLRWLDSEFIWRVSALQASQKNFLTVSICPNGWLIFQLRFAEPRRVRLPPAQAGRRVVPHLSPHAGF